MIFTGKIRSGRPLSSGRASVTENEGILIQQIINYPEIADGKKKNERNEREEQASGGTDRKK